ncbi:hypothetical protein LTR95_001392 [Oleoguttula sp. CCFEE 5521]
MSLLATAAKHLELSKSQSLESTERSTPLVANDPDDDGELSIVQAEERKRSLWAICSLDRFSSVAHGQPGGIDMRNIRLPYPKSDHQWEQDSQDRWYQAPTMKSSFHDADMGTSYDCQEWQSNFRRLDSSLTSWFSALPAQVREPQTNFSPPWVMLQATVYLIRTRMYTVAAFPSTTSPYVKASTAARLRCRDTITHVAALIQSLSPENLDCLPPMFASVLWVAARSLAILWTTNHESTPPVLTWTRYLSDYLIMDDTDAEAWPKLLEIFNDTRRTAYGLEKKLGKIAGSPSANQDLFSFDFLDMPFLDNDINDDSWLPLYSDNAVNDWL